MRSVDEAFLVLRGIQLDIFYKFTYIFMRNASYLVRFKWIMNFLDRFLKNQQMQKMLKNEI